MKIRKPRPHKLHKPKVVTFPTSYPQEEPMRRNRYVLELPRINPNDPVVSFFVVNRGVDINSIHFNDLITFEIIDFIGETLGQQLIDTHLRYLYGIHIFTLKYLDPTGVVYQTHNIVGEVVAFIYGDGFENLGHSEIIIKVHSRLF